VKQSLYPLIVDRVSIHQLYIQLHFRRLRVKQSLYPPSSTTWCNSIHQWIETLSTNGGLVYRDSIHEETLSTKRLYPRRDSIHEETLSTKRLYPRRDSIHEETLSTIGVYTSRVDWCIYRLYARSIRRCIEWIGV